MDVVRGVLVSDGYVELVGVDRKGRAVTSCLHSSQCPGPTFLHLFLRGLDLKVVTSCATCGGIRLLSTVEMDPPGVVG